MKTCSNCAFLLGDEDRFCGNCGISVKFENTKRNLKSTQLIIAFFVSMLVLHLISNFAYQESIALSTEIILELIFIGITLGFSLSDWSAIKPLYSFKNLEWKGLVTSLVLPLISVVVVYFLISEVNLYLFEEDPSIMEDYDYYDRPFLWAFIFISLVAPIFEELAFRGFLYNQMRDIASAQTTILATGFMFALIHLSLFSFIWIFPFGIALGYLRYKYKTLWWGMLVHFLHNTAVLAMDYHEYYGQWPLLETYFS